MRSRRGSPILESILESISSPIRLSMLKALSHQKLSYTELAKAIGLKRDKDAGKFSYHLKKLLSSGLIEVDSSSGKYALSHRGVKVLSLLERMEEELSDKTLMIVRRSDQTIEPFDKNKIAEALMKEAKLPPKLAKEIALIAEKKLLDLKIDYLTAPLIRELVNSILLDMGLEKYRHKLTRIGMPLHDAEDLLKRSIESEDWRMFVEEASGSIAKEYLLLSFLPRRVADMHLHGKIDIYPISGWLTTLFSKAVNLSSQDLLESAFELSSALLHTRREIMLRGAEPGISKLLKSIPGDLPKNLTLSFKLQGNVAALPEKFSRKLRENLGVLISFSEYDLKEMASISRQLDKLRIPYAYSLSDEVFYTGFRLDRGIQAVHSIVSLNVFGALMECGGDLDDLLLRLRSRIKLILPVLRRGLSFLEKFHKGLRASSMISLSGLVEASRLLAMDESLTVEESVELELKILKELSKAIPHPDDRIMLAGRCPMSAARRFLRMDLRRYDEGLLRKVAGGADAYSTTPIPGPKSFQNMDSWIDASKRMVSLLSGGFYVKLRSVKLSKALSEAIYLAENLRESNRHGIISIGRG